MDFQESKTKENLARSFAAECQEGARYQFMAKMAQQEGYQYMSMLIRTLAHNEMAHAQQFFNKIVELGGNQTQNIDISAGYPFRSKNGLLLQPHTKSNSSGIESLIAESKIIQILAFMVLRQERIFLDRKIQKSTNHKE